eukprot:TRINITY_DN11135_c0_g1_i2.p1 TRINITY_DN11135_c0_g1~~TRINITY_DN11135_c0_g1_i2.p1  ORF type:complete len:120 (+),score=19.29 TRINITY_DN11135_c0_g1_i2:65-424(+)
MCIRDRVAFPTGMSFAARDLISKLLTKDPEARLGGKSVCQVKEHEFFKGVDWNMVRKKKMQPPFCPMLRSELDLKHFDPTVIREAVVETPAPPARLHIKGFTFVPEDAMSRANQTPSKS